MDNLFVFQQKYDTIDQNILKEKVKETYKQNCDGYLDLPEGKDLTDWIFRNQYLPSVNRVTSGKYNIIPVGSIEFTEHIIGSMKPTEIPESLRRFCHRKYEILKGKDLQETDSDRYFFKDATKLKSWNSLLYSGDISKYIVPNHDYVFSEKVSFDAEYRVFVYQDEIMAVQRYLGQPTLFPKEGPIHWMINAYKEEPHPEAYTLDIGIRRSIRGSITEPIEVHPFVSCGLYGFDDPAIPEMLAAGIHWYKIQNT